MDISNAAVHKLKPQIFKKSNASLLCPSLHLSVPGRDEGLVLVLAQSEAFDWLSVHWGGGLREEGSLQLCLQVQIRDALLGQGQHVHLHLQTIVRIEKVIQ